MRKWIEIILGVLLALLLIFRGTELWLGSKLRKAAAQELYNMSDGVYKLDVGNLSVGLFDRSVKLRGLSILTDSTRLDRLTILTDTTEMHSDRVYKPCVRLNVAELYIKGLWFKRREGIAPDTARIHDAHDAHDAHDVTDQNIHNSITRIFEKLSISRIRVRGIDGEYSIRKGNDTIYYRLKRTGIEADDYDINSNPEDNPLYCKDIRVTARRFEHTYEYRSTSLVIDTLTLSTGNRRLHANSMKILPAYDKEEFAHKNPRHVDWKDIQLGQVHAEGFYFGKLVYHKQVVIDSVSIGRVEAGTFKDRNVQRTEWEKYMFYESVQKLPMQLSVGAISVLGGTAYYEEMPEGGKSSGIIHFTDLGCEAHGLTNMPNPPERYGKLSARGKLMGKGDLEVALLFPADSTHTRFELSGSLGAIDMQGLNPIVEPLAKVRIDSGRINILSFKVVGNRNHSSVSMQLLYNDLYVTMLREGIDGHEHDRKFVSALANNMVLRGGNPDKWGEYHAGTGSFERDHNKSQYNYLWKSLMPGIQSAVGIPNL